MKRRFLGAAVLAALLVAGQMPASAADFESNSLSTVLTTGKPKKKARKKSSKRKTTKRTTTRKSAATAKTATKTSKAAATSSASSENQSGESVIGGLLGGLLGGGSSSESTSSSHGSGLLGGLASALTTVFDANKTATADQLAGTWKYTEPAVVFESKNALQNIGGKVASSAIEKKLQKQLSRFGIKKGAMTMTFDKDGNFTQSVGRHKYSGTYTISGRNITLTYAGGIKQFVGTTQYDSGSLLIVMKADKLLKFGETIGKLTGNATVSTLSSLLGSYDGMEVGLRLKK